MPRIDGRVEVRCTPERAWELFTRFDDVARLIPSVEEVEIQGDRVLARVVVKLGALPISSRIVLEVTEQTPMACLKAVGVSYLGETVVEQLAKKELREIHADSVGRLDLHLDIRPGASEGMTAVIYEASVEADGRLRRIYDSILKTKAPGMMREFAENLRTTLEAPLPAGRTLPSLAAPTAVAAGPAPGLAPTVQSPAAATMPPTPSPPRAAAWKRKAQTPLFWRVVEAVVERLWRLVEGRR